jgi:hypothetical protein
MSMSSVKNLEGSSGNQQSAGSLSQNNEIYDMMFDDTKTTEELAIANSFVEKNVFQTDNTSFVKFTYLDTPSHVDQEKDSTSRVLIALHDTPKLGFYSLNSGQMNNLFDLNNPDIFNNSLDNSWSTKVHSLITDNYNEFMTVSISDSQGNLYILDLIMQSVSAFQIRA